jgi:hypothetical protein
VALHEPPSSRSLTPAIGLYGAVVAVPVLVVAIVVAVVSPAPLWLMLVLAVVLTAGLTLYRYRRVDAILLDHLDVVDADEVEHLRAFNLLESLSLRSGVAVPALYLTDDRSVNASAIQLGGDAAAIVTAGALERLDRLELEALLAEIIIRIADGDAHAATVAAGMAGLPFTQGPLSFLAPLADRAIRHALTEDREIIGDFAAVGLTRYPPALRNTLEYAADDATGAAGVQPATAYLWIVPRPPYEPHFDLAIRVDALNEF